MSLQHHTLKEILAGDFFADIQGSWATKDPIERCLEVCGKDIKDDMDTLGSMAVKRGVGAIALNAVAISLAFVNVAGGFAVTERMLGMFKKS